VPVLSRWSFSNCTAVLSTTRTTSDKHNDGSNKQQDKGCEARPHANTVNCMWAWTIFIHMVFDNPENHKVNNHDNQRNDPRNNCDKRSDQTADCTAERTESRDERQATCDGVQDKCVGQRVGDMRANGAKTLAINGGHDVHGLVANLLGRAVVLVRRYWRNIENAVAECAKGDWGVADISFVGESDFENSNVAYDGRRDCRDQEEYGRYEYEHDPNVMKPSKHDCGLHFLFNLEDIEGKLLRMELRWEEMRKTSNLEQLMRQLL